MSSQENTQTESRRSKSPSPRRKDETTAGTGLGKGGATRHGKGSTSLVPKKVVRLSERAGLILPVGRIHKRLRSHTKLSVSPKAAVKAAAVVEFIVKEAAKAGVLKAKELTPKPKDGKERKTKRLSPRILRLGIMKSEPLEALLQEQGITIFGGGVEPHAVERLMRQRQLRKEINERKKAGAQEIKKIREENQSDEDSDEEYESSNDVDEEDVDDNESSTKSSKRKSSSTKKKTTAKKATAAKKTASKKSTSDESSKKRKSSSTSDSKSTNKSTKSTKTASKKAKTH